MIRRILIIMALCVPQLFASQIYKGAEYRTKNSYLYGRFETRMKSAQREGMLTSFFTYNDMQPFASEKWNELDIEIMGRYTDEVQYNAITAGAFGHVGRVKTQFNPALDFHTYAIEWTPEYVAWFIDGAETYRQTGAHIQTLIYPSKIMMNIWIQSAVSWSGQWNENSLPAFGYYDYVSYASYTPGTGTIGTGSNFTPQWKDDFDVYDATRWDKATHTFGGNLCDFIPENIVFKDGCMILCLTKETALGYQDAVAPNVSSARAEADGVVISYYEEVDSVSAVTPANYLVPGGTVSSVTLFSDKKTVRLNFDTYDTAAISSVLIRNVKDRFSPANTLGGKSVTITKPARLSFPVKINCGGPAYQEYLADQTWRADREYGYLDGTLVQTSGTVRGGIDPVIFQTAINAPVEYRVRVPNGTYAVFLLMSENYYSDPGKRLFDVAVQDVVVENNLDLFAKVGRGIQYQKVVPNVKVTEGLIDIHFLWKLDFAVLNGIHIVQISTTGVNTNSQTVPDKWEVGQNFPNPFNGTTVIPFILPHDDTITIQFFDLLGRKVSEHQLGTVGKGRHTFSWNARNDIGASLASGPYYYIVKGAQQRAARKLVLVQ
ncbi:MAG TPA: family 16 glycosylhydrolase [Bacteroidota bacterium]|nr:family 16 glycosylhydrolase [Bacteroidota bacterium]